MVTGLEGASSVAGVVSLVGLSLQLVESCYKGFDMLSRARNCRQDALSFRLMLEIELTKLFVWADEAGLNMKPPLLHVGLQYAPLVPRVLQELHHLLNDTHRLRSRYHLQLEVTSEEIVDLEPDASAFRRLDLVSQVDVEDCTRTLKTVFDNRVKPWKRLRWVTVDEKKFEKLLKQIDFFVCELRGFLEVGKRQSIQARCETLVRTAVMNTENQDDLHLLGRYGESTYSPPRDLHGLERLSLSSRTTLNDTAIAATAHLKQKGLLLGFFKPWNATENLPVSPTLTSPAEYSNGIQTRPSTQPLMKLNPKLLTLKKSLQRYPDRQLAWYNNEPVILEWRMMDQMSWNRMEVRVEKLSYLLQQMTDRSFHSLPCRGWVSNIVAGRYGYVFDLPSFPNPGVPLRTPQPKTLRDALEASTSSPSLNLKLMCATTLMETVLQLHTAGWLHKQIRSDNVLVFGPSPDHSNSTAWRSGSFDEHTSCYLAGYTYTRADDPQDFTETIRSSQETDIYRHPQSLFNPYSPSIGRLAQYRMSFDIFSLGCILLEIGLWSSLASILRRTVPPAPSDASQSRAPLRKRVGAAEETPMRGMKFVPDTTPNYSSGNATKSPPALPLARHEDDSLTNSEGGFTLMSARSLLLQQLQDGGHASPATLSASSSSSENQSLIEAVLHHLAAQTGKNYAAVVTEFLLIDACNVSDEIPDAETDDSLKQNSNIISKTVTNATSSTDSQVTIANMRALALETRALARLKNLAEAL